MWYIVFGAAVTATSVILSRPSAVGASGQPGLLYALSGGAWALVLFVARVAWRQRPEPTGLRVWQASPRFHGRYHDTVTVHGVTRDCSRRQTDIHSLNRRHRDARNRTRLQPA